MSIPEYNDLFNIFRSTRDIWIFYVPKSKQTTFTDEALALLTYFKTSLGKEKLPIQEFTIIRPLIAVLTTKESSCILLCYINLESKNKSSSQKRMKVILLSMDHSELIQNRKVVGASWKTYLKK